MVDRRVVALACVATGRGEVKLGGWGRGEREESSPAAERWIRLPARGSAGLGRRRPPRPDRARAVVDSWVCEDGGRAGRGRLLHRLIFFLFFKQHLLIFTDQKISQVR